MNKHLLTIFVSLIGIGFFYQHGIAEPINSNSLTSKLARLNEQSKSPESRMNIQEIERDYLQLQSDAPSDGEKGEIFAGLAALYHLNMPNNISKIKDYSSKALSFLISADLKCQMYDYLADTYRISMDSISPDEIIAYKARMAELYLKGLALILENTLEENSKEPPAVPKYRHVGSETDVEASRLEHAKKMEYRKNVLANNKLMPYRQKFIESSVALYKNPPANIEDLEILLKKHLSGQYKVTKSILDQVKMP